MIDIGTVESEKIYRLQSNLSILRKVAGWSAEDLASMIGVTRQTIVNLENSDSYKMTKIQYLAIRAVLEAEVESSKNVTLGQVINILVDSNNVSEEAKDRIKETVTVATSSLGNRVGSVAAGAAAIAALATVLGPLSMSAVGSLMFARELLKETKKKK